ncbi:MAG: 50S ribosomal protein L21 [Candidatus Parabeggiatoa sp. nov. 2]|nr:MAG: 50S ribosomal protein L21 [Beggiatoa sp. 4572_84]RKZ64237.1 MAG: 50S ribosomal protein L21 [Gammaproteobacteria bacterium]
MYAVIQTGGKQHKVVPGSFLTIEKIPGEVGASVDFNDVLMVANGDDVRIGAPQVDGGKVTAIVHEQGRGKKINILKFKRRKHHLKRMGHRQHYTDVRITGIMADGIEETWQPPEKPAAEVEATPSDMVAEALKVEVTPSDTVAEVLKVEATSSDTAADTQKVEVTPSDTVAEALKVKATSPSVPVDTQKAEATPSDAAADTQKVEVTPPSVSVEMQKLEAAPSDTAAEAQKVEVTPPSTPTEIQKSDVTPDEKQNTEVKKHGT